MKIYIFSITYNFSTSYIAKKCDTYEDALKMLNDYLNQEVETVKNESGYTPIIKRWIEDDVKLIYAEECESSDENYDSDSDDCAYYRIFAVEV